MAEDDESQLPETVSVGGVEFEFTKFDKASYQWIHQMTDDEIAEWLGEEVPSTDVRREWTRDDEDNLDELVTREAEEGELTYVDEDELGFSVTGNEETNRPMLIVTLQYSDHDENWLLSGAETIQPNPHYGRGGDTEPLGNEYSMTFDSLDEALPSVEEIASKLVERL